MAVFVDDMYLESMGQFKTRSGRVYKMSHMIADTDEELHAMAVLIGVSRDHFQKPGTHGRHYDIAMSKRALAVKAGAVEITLRQASAMCQHRKHHGVLCAPEDALAWRRSLKV